VIPGELVGIPAVSLKDGLVFGLLSANCQLTRWSIANPPTTTLPFSPRMEIDPSRSLGRHRRRRFDYSQRAVTKANYRRSRIFRFNIGRLAAPSWR
jgi:hypothetical protein